ncbi:hypothetical protein QQS21_011743 [Conoideocrella luteorostrata]|uniref:SRR1-like domain-containing protein n=1 Tax=Conoideocrella luteorostrata TaxID=1105319 RepID=A0AAJ0FTE5_9HYPO|nr:hypothetical protein QQS21_011743 [Conoideocrella luteorostrata]
MSDCDTFSLVSSNDNEEWGDEIPPTESEKASEAAFIARVWEKYNAGVPLYTKEMIRFAQQQISQNPLPYAIQVLGFDGELHPNTLPLWWSAPSERRMYPVLMFASIEEITSPAPHRILSQEFACVRVGGQSRDGTLSVPEVPLNEAGAGFEANFQLWEQSETWKQLKQSLGPCLARLPEIDKIIGFGLGYITGREYTGDVESRKDGPCTQHALLITLARYLEQETGRAVKCYVQDPAYSDTCKAVLGARNIEVLEPEDGFLLVDDKSVVLSFSPNVPVRQITADLARPAMMIWDRVVLPTERPWRRLKRGGWLSPHTTDPVSPRVLAMAREYTEIPSDDEFLRAIGVYVRQD